MWIKSVNTYPSYPYAASVEPHQQYGVPAPIELENVQEANYETPATSHIEQFVVIPQAPAVATEEASVAQPHIEYGLPEMSSHGIAITEPHTDYGVPYPIENEQYSDHKPNYKYAYGVYDGRTGDVKGHRESRVGNNVIGSYDFIEADGRKRTVFYTADENGFNADVQHEENPSIPYPTELVRRALLQSNRPAKPYYGLPE